MPGKEGLHRQIIHVVLPFPGARQDHSVRMRFQQLLHTRHRWWFLRRRPRLVLADLFQCGCAGPARSKLLKDFVKGRVLASIDLVQHHTVSHAFPHGTVPSSLATVAMHLLAKAGKIEMYSFKYVLKHPVLTTRLSKRLSFEICHGTIPSSCLPILIRCSKEVAAPRILGFVACHAGE